MVWRWTVESRECHCSAEKEFLALSKRQRWKQCTFISMIKRVRTMVFKRCESFWIVFVEMILVIFFVGGSFLVSSRLVDPLRIGFSSMIGVKCACCFELLLCSRENDASVWARFRLAERCMNSGRGRIGRIEGLGRINVVIGVALMIVDELGMISWIEKEDHSREKKRCSKDVLPFSELD